MSKFYRSVLMAGVVSFGLAACGDDVTITDPPEPPAPGVTSVTVAPQTATVGIGQSVVFAASVIADNGVSTAVSWSSSDPSIATVDGTGKVTGVAAGTTTIVATSGADAGKTGVGTIVVQGAPQVIPAQVSIQSITQGLTNIPVPLNNVQGQIEVNLNFNPGNQKVDSIKVFIGGIEAAKQTFVASPAAGVITMSINTADFTTNATAGTSSVRFLNGLRQIEARVYVNNGPVIATQATNIVLNNTNGFAAVVTKPTNFTVGNSQSAAPGQTFWGGPAASGVTTVTVIPVMYDGRSINTVTFGFGGCPTVTDATLPFSTTYGVTGAATSCAGYEWTGGARDQAYIVSSIDNASNSGPNGGLIANTTVFASTPDSIRVDYKGPVTVSTPVIAGSEGFNWVNDAWSIRPTTPVVTDNGVGASNTTYNVFVNNTGSTTVFGTAYTNTAALAETNTNCAAPTPGCDGYAARATGADLLGNTTNSSVAATFGVDRTLPTVRYASIANTPSIFTAGGSTAVTDSTTRVVYAGLYGVDAGTINFDLTDYLAAAAGTNDSIRVETIDNRAGLSRTVVSSRVFGQGGATGTTVNTGCQTTTGTFGAALVDGYRPTNAVHVTCGSAAAGYYTTTFSVVDRAGNISSTYRRTVAIDPNPPQVTGVSPVANYVGNGATNFSIGVQDDLEVVDARLRLRYNNLLLGDGSTTASPSLVWTYGFSSAFSTRFDNSIVNPFLGTLTLDMFTVSIQETCTGAGAPFAACLFRGDPVPTASQALVKPDSVAVTVRDVWGSFAGNIVPWNIPGRQTGVSAEFASPILSATVPATGAYGVTYDGQTICLAGGTLNGPCVTSGINWRNFASTATTRTFRATQDNSTTLPIFTRVDLFGLNAAGEWQFIQRINVPTPISPNTLITTAGGTILGSDNGGERYWDYTFTNLTGLSAYTQFRALGVNATGHGLFSTRMP